PRAANTVITASTRLRSHSIAVTRFLYGRTNRGVNAESSLRDRNSPATADTGLVNTRRRCAGNDNRHRLPAGAELANDSGAFCAGAVDFADVPIHQRQAAAGRDGNQHEFARTRGGTG